MNNINNNVVRKRQIVELLKNNKLLFNFYYYLFGILVKILKLFIKTNDNLMLFVCSGGAKYGDNVSPIFEEMIKDDRFKNAVYVWAFIDPDKFAISEKAEKVKIDTLQYFITALKARCWITNVAVERGLKIDNNNIFYFNTWHGVPLKYIGIDAKKSKTFAPQKFRKPNLVCAQGDYDAAIMEKAMQLEENQVLISGYPRNDILLRIDEKYKSQIRHGLGIPDNKKVILYAPTYREMQKEFMGNHFFSFPFDADKWIKKFSDEFVFLFRAHPTVSKVIKNYKENQFFYDVSSHGSIEYLLSITDILISDYSGVFFDFSILERPMLCYAYDYEEYKKARGLYVDLDNFFPFKVCRTEEELIYEIMTLDYKKGCEKTREFKKKHIKEYGNSSKLCVDSIAQELFY